MKNFAVIGNPISQSLSPLMHNWIFNTLGLDAKYTKIQVSNNDVFKIIQQIKEEKWNGINVTIPYKKSIIQYLDSINTRAESIGSVNCIMKVDSKIIGNNTDWYGFIMLMKQNDIDLNNKSVVVLGAGGAAKAIIFSLIQMGIKKIDVLNRTIKKALELQNNYIFAHELDNAEKIIQNNSVIINTTSVGMCNNESPINYDLIHKDQIIIDIIYTPLRSKLLQFGETAGALTINGLDMFINQGLASLDLWFGSSISTQVNFSDIKRYLKSQLC
tara:strand:- start:1628 stop:2443 length:816 start_codon:yes stop_codon:yes gene_type:complete